MKRFVIDIFYNEEEAKSLADYLDTDYITYSEGHFVQWLVIGDAIHKAIWESREAELIENANPIEEIEEDPDEEFLEEFRNLAPMRIQK